MSNHYWVEQGYGMFLNNEEAEVMVEKFIKKHPNKYNGSVNEEFYELLQNEFGATIIDDDSFDGRSLLYLTADKYSGCGDGVMLYGSKRGTVFADEAETKCYKNIDDMADDIRKTYGEYLPDNFDYKSHLVRFAGVTFS